MTSRIVKFPRARAVALAVGVGALASLASAPASFASIGSPLAGGNCQANDSSANGPTGKISGRGGTLQFWSQFALNSGYSTDVCGFLPAFSNSNYPALGTSGTANATGDTSDPSSPVINNPTFKSDWMVLYNAPTAQGSSGTGSGNGRAAISCRTDAYATTDIPYANADENHWLDAGLGLDPQVAHPNNKNTSGSACITWNSGATVEYLPPFTPNSQTNAMNTGNGTGSFTSDTGGAVLSFPNAIAAVAMPINFGGTSGCPAAGGSLALSTGDVKNIWGGLISNWDQVTDSTPSLAGCNLSIIRVVRNDTSGTTQALLNYLANANGLTTPTCSTAANTSNGTFGDMDLHVTTGNNSNNGHSLSTDTWPNQGGTCPAGTLIRDSGSSGANSLLGFLDQTAQVGGIGYADISDTNNDPGDLAHLTVPTIQSFNGPQAAPSVGGASNCKAPGSANLPSGTDGAVGLNGDWAVDATGSGLNPADSISTKAIQGSAYPACGLTWSLVWAGDDGNAGETPPAATTASGAAQAVTTATLNVASTAGYPATGGNLYVTTDQGSGSGPFQNTVLNYTGITGNSFTGVTCNNGPLPVATQSAVMQNIAAMFPVSTISPYPCTGQIDNGANVSLWGGNPESYLTNDQRRTLYNYFTYVLSDPGQANLAGAGYAPLSEAYINTERQEFQSLF